MTRTDDQRTRHVGAATLTTGRAAAIALSWIETWQSRTQIRAERHARKRRG